MHRNAIVYMHFCFGIFDAISLTCSMFYFTCCYMFMLGTVFIFYHFCSPFVLFSAIEYITGNSKYNWRMALNNIKKNKYTNRIQWNFRAEEKWTTFGEKKKVSQTEENKSIRKRHYYDQSQIV